VAVAVLVVVAAMAITRSNRSRTVASLLDRHGEMARLQLGDVVEPTGEVGHVEPTRAGWSPIDRLNESMLRHVLHADALKRFEGRHAAQRLEAVLAAARWRPPAAVVDDSDAPLLMRSWLRHARCRQATRDDVIRGLFGRRRNR
jgi:hypothetical protein